MEHAALLEGDERFCIQGVDPGAFDWKDIDAIICIGSYAMRHVRYTLFDM